jgi:gas vesicle protein
MRRLLSLLTGFGLGAAAGWALVTLFSPISGDEFKANLRDHYTASLAAARQAAANRRAELEKELAELRGEA